MTSFSGPFQPLIVDNGVAYTNDHGTASSQTAGGGGYESGLSSLNPNQIATAEYSEEYGCGNCLWLEGN